MKPPASSRLRSIVREVLAHAFAGNGGPGAPPAASGTCRFTGPLLYGVLTAAGLARRKNRLRFPIAVRGVDRRRALPSWAEIERTSAALPSCSASLSTARRSTVSARRWCFLKDVARPAHQRDRRDPGGRRPPRHGCALVRSVPGTPVRVQAHRTSGLLRVSWCFLCVSCVSRSSAPSSRSPRDRGQRAAGAGATRARPTAGASDRGRVRRRGVRNRRRPSRPVPGPAATRGGAPGAVRQRAGALPGGRGLSPCAACRSASISACPARTPDRIVRATRSSSATCGSVSE